MQNSLTKMWAINEATGFLFSLYPVSLLIPVRYKYIFKHQLIHFLLLMKVCGKIALWEQLSIYHYDICLLFFTRFFKPTVLYTILLFHTGFIFMEKVLRITGTWEFIFHKQFVIFINNAKKKEQKLCPKRVKWIQWIKTDLKTAS